MPSAREGKASPLPRITDLAARVRDGEQLRDIATEYGVSYQTLLNRFSTAGFSGTGETGRRLVREALYRPYTPEPWMAQARCAETDPEAFFPEKGESTADAKKVCRGCEVISECLEYALKNRARFGVWGGKSEMERRKLKADAA